MKKSRNLLLLLLAAVPAILAAPSVARVRLGDLPLIFARAPQAIAELPAEEIGAFVARGRHAGFDTNMYPGDRAMLAWRDSPAPYEWVGYYLPAPCHKDESWSGKRATLTSMGWGLAVIYVGQQTWDGVRSPSARVIAAARRNGGLTCHGSLLSASRGRQEADDAIARTSAEGFPFGTVIFLDVEYMDRTPERMRSYYSAWVARVLEDGRYRPGIYAHTRNAERIHSDVREVFAAAGVREEPPFWIASGRRHFSPEERAPHEVGHAFADVWQGVLDVAQTWNGVTLPIDVNVAASPSPSAREYASVYSVPVRGGYGD